MFGVNLVDKQNGYYDKLFNENKFKKNIEICKTKFNDRAPVDVIICSDCDNPLYMNMNKNKNINKNNNIKYCDCNVIIKKKNKFIKN